MRLLYVPLSADELSLLKAIALRERRRPQDQAAVLLSQVLEADPLKHDPPADASRHHNAEVAA